MLLAESGDVSTASGLEVVSHAVVEGEHTGGGSDLSTHVADGGHAYVVGMGAHVNTRGWSKPNKRGARLRANGQDNTVDPV